jgi:hypothetical protein
MAIPRKVTVAITVGLCQSVDVTNDITAFTFEESIAGAGETIDLSLDNRNAV